MFKLRAIAGDIAYQLKRGFAYRSIQHAQMRLFTTWLPLALAMITTVAFALLSKFPKIYGDKALLDNTLTVIATLPGFYFAGLAAVATFGGGAMDQPMADPAPKIKWKIGGQFRVDSLTRRLFLCYLFSYLVIISFAICVALIFVSAAEDSVHDLKSYMVDAGGAAQTWWWVKIVCIFVLNLPIASLAVSTLHGIYFLTERMHQP